MEREDIEKKFNQEHANFVLKCPVVKLTLEEYHKAVRYAANIKDPKSKEKHNKIDSDSIGNRYLSGVLTEMVVEKYLEISFNDWESIGKSSEYDEPDLRKLGLKCGVKSSKFGYYPLIKEETGIPQIIVIQINQLEYRIIGCALPDVIEGHLDANLKYGSAFYNSKKGFYGLDKVKLFSNLEELKEILNPPLKGKIKLLKSGYGFILGEDKKDYFLLQSEVVNRGFLKLKIGDSVSFYYEDSSQSPEAKKVKKI